MVDHDPMCPLKAAGTWNGVLTVEDGKWYVCPSCLALAERDARVLAEANAKHMCSAAIDAARADEQAKCVCYSSGAPRPSDLLADAERERNAALAEVAMLRESLDTVRALEAASMTQAMELSDQVTALRARLADLRAKVKERYDDDSHCLTDTTRQYPTEFLARRRASTDALMWVIALLGEEESHG